MRSSRSTPTGPGSRGGHWHEQEYRRAYFRAWRKAHPEYQERERRRSLLNKAIDRLTRIDTVAGART